MLNLRIMKTYLISALFTIESEDELSLLDIKKALRKGAKELGFTINDQFVLVETEDFKW